MALSLIPEKIDDNLVKRKRYRDKQKFPHLGKRVNLSDIDVMIKQVYGNAESHTIQSLHEALEKNEGKQAQQLF